MTLPELLRILARRWYVVLIGVAATLALCARLWVPDPVYWTKAEVLFIEPGISSADAYLSSADETLVPFAAAVELAVNQGQQTQRLSSQDATLYGTGLRSGSSLQLKNVGNQWAPSFPRPVLTIEVVGESPEEVLETYSGLLKEVRYQARELQKAQGVPRDSMIRLVPQFEQPTPGFVGATRRGHARALAAALLVGFGLTVSAAVAWDRLATRRRRTGPASSATTPDAELTGIR